MAPEEALDSWDSPSASIHSRPASGGEQQRVAIARAIASGRHPALRRAHRRARQPDRLLVLEAIERIHAETRDDHRAHPPTTAGHRGLSDRLLVMGDGRIQEERRKRDTTARAGTVLVMRSR